MNQSHYNQEPRNQPQMNQFQMKQSQSNQTEKNQPNPLENQSYLVANLVFVIEIEMLNFFISFVLRVSRTCGTV